MGDSKEPLPVTTVPDDNVGGTAGILLRREDWIGGFVGMYMTYRPDFWLMKAIELNVRSCAPESLHVIREW